MGVLDCHQGAVVVQLGLCRVIGKLPAGLQSTEGLLLVSILEVRLSEVLVKF